MKLTKKRHSCVRMEKDGLTLVQGFYDADILRDQYTRNKIPVLVVGPGFYMLGGQDKRRVTATVDHVWNITGGHPDGIFMLEDWRTGNPVGTYTKDGWLNIGVAGSQPDQADTYNTTGSLYFCSVILLPLGLPDTDAFWSSPPEQWTAQKIWSGQDVSGDHSID